MRDEETTLSQTSTRRASKWALTVQVAELKQLEILGRELLGQFALNQRSNETTCPLNKTKRVCQAAF